MTNRILSKLAHIPIEIISESKEITDELALKKDPAGESKKYLLIARQKGDFVKPCPCTPCYLGCNYFIINVDLNCPLDCTYCILQLYLSDSLITVCVNTDDLWNQLDRFLDAHTHRTLRIGTGELSDSLALDHITDRSKELIAYFRKRKNALFELKTKTINIENVLESEPSENIVIAWSLNPEYLVKREEKGAPSLKERVEAARAVLDKGFRVAFHFDPIIRYSGWEDGYKEAVDVLFTRIDPGRIAWISLGSLRFPPNLKNIIRERFPGTRILDEELIRGEDGKIRYFKPLRLALYREVAGHIRSAGRDRVPLYFCMENEEIWRKILGKKPKGKEEIELYLSLPFGNVR